MEKIEVYKHIKNHYEVVLHHDKSDISNSDIIRTATKQQWIAREKYLNSEDKYLEHFANKLASVHHIIYTSVMEKSEDKISFKFFFNEKYRPVGVHWFKKNRLMRFITLNLKTGILYTGFIGGLHNKKPKKQIRANKFWGNLGEVFEFAADTMVDVYSPQNCKNYHNSLIKLFIEQIYDWPFDNMKEGNTSNSLDGMQFYQYYLMKKKVKLPDNFMVFEGYKFNIPSKLFKKANYKYIDALLLHYGLQGEKFRKAFHEIKKYNPTLESLKFVVDLVGKTRVEQDYKMLVSLLSHTHTVQNHYDISWITEPERKNIWSILTTTSFNLLVIRDHINFLSFLRSRGLDYKWRAKTSEQFNLEHKMLSDTMDTIKNGLIHRVYPKQYHEYFIDPIKVGDVQYMVKILDEQSEFYKESEYQQNCVKTYISRPGSFIISIRDGKEHATVEYNVNSSDTHWLIDRAQFLGRFNKALPSSWNPILKKVDKMISDMFGQYGFEMTLHKVQNDVTKTWNLILDENGRPKWNNTLEIVDDDDYFFF